MFNYVPKLIEENGNEVQAERKWLKVSFGILAMSNLATKTHDHIFNLILKLCWAVNKNLKIILFYDLRVYDRNFALFSEKLQNDDYYMQINHYRDNE